MLIRVTFTIDKTLDHLKRGVSPGNFTLERGLDTGVLAVSRIPQPGILSGNFFDNFDLASVREERSEQLLGKLESSWIALTSELRETVIDLDSAMFFIWKLSIRLLYRSRFIFGTSLSRENVTRHRSRVDFLGK